MDLELLLPFQREDVTKLDVHANALIANDMGTGKTYEAIARDSLIRQRHKGSTLVVAPLSVLSSWKYHFEELTDLRVAMVDRTQRTAFLKEDADVYLVHWDALRLLPDLRNRVWMHVIADEAHRVKNRKAKQTLALKKIKAAHKSALTGTPVINEPPELWSILNWLWPRTYTSYWQFFNSYTESEVVYPGGYRKVIGPRNELELQKRMGPYTVRRLKAEVLPELPDKYATTVWVELDPKQRRAYESMRKDMLAWVGEHEHEPLPAPAVIAQLVRLQQFALAFMTWNDETERFVMSEPSAKLDALMELINDRDGEQVVVFSQFTSSLALLERRLIKKGITYAKVTGDVKDADRTKAIEDFQAGKARVFFGTIAAGGVGITLTAASTVIFLDRSWSPALNQQAEDRLHRIGQQNAVEVIDIMAVGTVDLGRRARLEQKWTWIKQLLGDR